MSISCTVELQLLLAVSKELCLVFGMTVSCSFCGTVDLIETKSWFWGVESPTCQSNYYAEFQKLNSVTPNALRLVLLDLYIPECLGVIRQG